MKALLILISLLLAGHCNRTSANNPSDGVLAEVIGGTQQSAIPWDDTFAQAAGGRQVPADFEISSDSAEILYHEAGACRTGAALQTINQPDSLAFAKLDTMLSNYTQAITNESTDVKSAECDFLISSVKDSLTMQHIALWLWDKYKDSELMGDEAVAIHIYDNWFKDGTIAMRSEFDKLDADIFTAFNRSTLLGMKAPTVDLKTPCGRKVRIPQDGSHSILFFFDTGCAKCQLESKVLPGIIEKVGFPTKVYAVFCGHDKAQWRKFRRTFKVRNKKVGIVHAWDPELETDMLRLYGVISTPRLYFTDTDGEILGRRLEPESLAEIIQYINAYYGQKENK